MQQEEAFHTLRKLLLEQEWESLSQKEEEIAALQEIWKDHDKLQEQLKPHFKEHIEYLQEHFPDLFRKSLTEALERQIVESRDEVIDALYPIIGRLISRYIKAEFVGLNERIDRAQRDFFSLKHWQLRLKAWMSGVSYQEMIINTADEARLEEIFLIDSQSGLLMGHYSLHDLLDPDLIAGMLTGIKEFVEHAFLKDAQSLEELEYQKFKVLVRHVHSYYFAVVIEGNPNAQFHERLEKSLITFLETYPVAVTADVHAAGQAEISTHLKSHFYGFNQMDQ